MKKISLFLLQSFVLYLAIKISQRLYLNENVNESQLKTKTNETTNSANNTNNTFHYIIDPLNGSSLGRHTWAVMHSIAASYPNKPNKTEQDNFEMFFNGFIARYPCCQDELQTIIKDNPLEHGSREELVYYICELHNIVNSKANKPKFNCRHAFDIWGGDCGCDS